MSYCERCGFRLPEGSSYCPSCGARVGRKIEAAMPSASSVAKILQAGVLGAFLSIMIRSLSPQQMDLYFIPSFISSLIAVYLYRTRRLDEAVTVALAVYLFADGIIAAIALGTLYSQRMPLAELYGDYVPTLMDVIMYAAGPVTAVIAGYIGNRLTSKTQAGEALPTTYGRKEEPGGVIYSLRRETEKAPASSTHKV